MNRVPIPTLITAVLLVAALVAYAVTFQVRFSEVAVRVKLGKADESSVVREPGIYFRWPWPIETIERYDRRLQTTDTPEAEVKTFDGKNVITGAFAVWRIEDPLRYFVRVKTRREAENQMRARLTQAQAAAFGQLTMADLFNLDPELVEKTHERLKAELLGDPGRPTSLVAAMKSEYGIELREVGIRRISLPETVSQTVFQSMIAERRTKAERFKAEGKSIADAITATAEADARKILAFAERKAQEVRSTGIQASTNLLRQIEAEDSEFFQYLRWLDALREMLRNRTTIFLDQQSLMHQPFVTPPGERVRVPRIEGAPIPVSPAAEPE
jgi:membrane protease subunit HflC